MLSDRRNAIRRITSITRKIMGKATSEFGAGILEDIELTDREIAIAQGDDPDAVETDDSLVGEAGDGEGGSGDVAPADRPAEETWSDDDKAAAAKYGISDEELAEFGSPKALHKAIALLERKQPVEPTGGVAAQPASDAAGGDTTDTDKPADDKPESKADDKPQLAKLNIEKLRETFGDDPDTMEVIEGLAKTQEYIEQSEKRMQERMAQFEEQVFAQQVQRNNEIFHNTLDDYPDEFGVSVKGGKPVALSKEHETNRIKVRDAAETIYAGLVAKKAAIPPLPEILEMAIRQVNGVPRKTTDRRQALVTQASLKKSPGSAAAATRRTAPPPDGSPESIASHPEIDRFWREAQEANGAS